MEITLILIEHSEHILDSRKGPLTHLPSKPNYINRLLSIFHQPQPSLFLSAPLQRLIFRAVFHLFLSVSDVDGRAAPPPLHQQIILLTPHHSRRVSPPLCFQLDRSLAPTCTALLSTSDYLSHFAPPQECRPLYANPVVLSVPRTHRRNTAHRNHNNCLQKNKKTISQTSLFYSDHLPWIFLSVCGNSIGGWY